MKKISIFSVSFLTFLFSINVSLSQNGANCNSASPMCPGIIYNFPMGYTPGASPGQGQQAQTGPNYGCLGSPPNYSTPSPIWYYFKILNPGLIQIYMSSTPQVDIDFICWGPFTSQTTPCVSQLTAANTADCSFSASWNETCDVSNATTGKFYLLMITNYSNQPCNVSFSQSNEGQPGAGSLDCGIMPPTTSNNGPICEGDTLKLFANGLPNAQYFWSGPNNFSSTLQNPKIPNASIAAAGDYFVVIMSGTQISPEDTTIAVIHPKPVVTATADTICIGQAASILASGANTYAWSPGGTSNPLNVSPTVSTNYTVIGTTTFGCKDTTTTFITVNPKPVVTATSAAICALDSATITASGAATYLWSNGFNTPQIKVSPALTTTYSVIGTSAQNCVDSTTSIVTINPNPNITINDVDICAGKTAQLSVLNGSASDTYQWSNGNTGNVITVSPPATTLFWVNATDVNGCKDSDSAFVTIHPLPIAQFMADPNKTTTENPTINFVDQSTNADIWKWTFGESFAPNNTSALQSPSHTYNGVGEYIVWQFVQSTFGCRDSIHHSVIIENPYAFYIPNAFSPNSIHIDNKTFKAKGIGIDNEKYEMLIYDRWGKVIFETKDMDAGWNGQLNNTGEFVPSGVYVYYIRFKQKYGVEKEFCGHVTLF